VRYFDTKEEVKQYLLEHARPGDVVLTMGAGDIWRVAHELVPALEEKRIVKDCG
jgi:UDP-N-acetylmuramate--alanine ligase